MKRLLPLFAIVLLAINLGTAHAEKRADSKPAKATKALQGYCPVAYVEMGKAVKGDPKIWSELDARKYHFSNADAKTMFDANPKGIIEKADAAWADLNS